MNRERLTDPPLVDDDLVRTWLACIDAWASGQRGAALGHAEGLLSDLEGRQDEQRAAFAGWFCERLFDDSDAWAGQFGGGLAYEHGGFNRPIEYALSMNPFTTRLVVPYLSVAALERHGHALRWLWQALSGLAYRVPPAARAELERTMRSVSGPEAEPLDVLRRAAAKDEGARKWLNEIELEGDEGISADSPAV